MRRLFVLLLALTAGCLAASPVRAVDLPPPGDLVSAHLVAETASAAPGSVLWADVRLKVKPGWHIYWRNPGDAGLPTEIAWRLPPDFSAGAIEWPVPERFKTGDLANYGYEDDVDLLVPITVPKALDAGDTVRLAADVTWLACTEICIPGAAKLSLDLPIGTGAADPANTGIFAAARARLPKPAGFTVGFAADAHDYRMIVPASAVSGLAHPTAAFFPYDGNAIDQAAEQRGAASGDGLTLTVARLPGPAKTELSGLLVLHGDGVPARAFTIGARAAPPPAEDATAWWDAVLLAFLAGLVLNLMPCVFPILSLKVLSLANLAHRDDGLRHGVAYAVGVVLSFAVLGGILLALREGGMALGWGFQLQSPAVVGLLAYLLMAMGLSLSGVAEFGAGLAGTGASFAERGGLAGAFAAGVLATIVATPCTAPFMGTALGYALVAPAPVALAVFVALGLGLAAPFLVASAIPAAGRLLPHPGPWMVTTRQILAFPLYGTVAWLIWVLMQEVAPGDALMVMFGLVAVGFAVWVYGRTRMRWRRLGATLAVLSVAGAITLAATAAPATAPQAAARDGLPYEAFSSARLAALTADKKPVFVNLTASWCITCLFNEHATLDSTAIRHAFAAHGVTALKGDWTRRNPDITAFLQQHGRSGVPLYLLYDKSGEATVLPQILTEAAVLDAVGKI
ncbi:MAG TPA: protein-disulfide reductase DsbD domain-containing protein [Stellaceae bacterium]|nr:protein-disulfide reductase DsbD domain-containing protein [Stellaceae bacterium]